MLRWLVFKAKLLKRLLCSWTISKETAILDSSFFKMLIEPPHPSTPMCKDICHNYTCKVMKSASIWRGWYWSLRPLMTGTLASSAITSRSCWPYTRAKIRSDILDNTLQRNNFSLPQSITVRHEKVSASADLTQSGPPKVPASVDLTQSGPPKVQASVDFTQFRPKKGPTSADLTQFRSKNVSASADLTQLRSEEWPASADLTKFRSEK